VNNWSDNVNDGSDSIVYQDTENRLHTTNIVTAIIIGDKQEKI